jgi:hypothetical protein
MQFPEPARRQQLDEWDPIGKIALIQWFPPIEPMREMPVLILN